MLTKPRLMLQDSCSAAGMSALLLQSIELGGIFPR